LKHDGREHAGDTLEGFRVDEGAATLKLPDKLGDPV